MKLLLVSGGRIFSLELSKKVRRNRAIEVRKAKTKPSHHGRWTRMHSEQTTVSKSSEAWKSTKEWSNPILKIQYTYPNESWISNHYQNITTMAHVTDQHQIWQLIHQNHELFVHRAVETLHRIMEPTVYLNELRWFICQLSWSGIGMKLALILIWESFRSSLWHYKWRTVKLVELI
jgi:hypothetical protein